MSDTNELLEAIRDDLYAYVDETLSIKGAASIQRHAEALASELAEAEARIERLRRYAEWMHFGVPLCERGPIWAELGVSDEFELGYDDENESCPCGNLCDLAPDAPGDLPG